MARGKHSANTPRKLFAQGLVPTGKLAAMYLGVTGPALSVWTKQDWFDPDWKTKDGKDDCYNVVAIQAARTERGGNRLQQIERGVIPTRELAARFLGVTGQALALWTKENWFDPAWKTRVGPDDCYNIVAIRAARDAMGRKGSEQSETTKRLKLDLDREKLKQSEIATGEKQLGLRQREGDVIERRAVELHFATLLTALSDWCDQIPELIAADVPRRHAPRIKKRLQGELDRRRHRLRNDLEREARQWGEAQQSAET